MTTAFGNPARFVEDWLARVLATVAGFTVKRVGTDTITTATRVYPYVVGGDFPAGFENGTSSAMVTLRCIIEIEGKVTAEGATPTGKEANATFDAIYKCIDVVLAANYEADNDAGTPFDSRIAGVTIGGHDGIYARNEREFKVGVEIFVTCNVSK